MQSAENSFSERTAHESGNSLQLYLHEIGRTPLLTVEEEIVLAARIRHGDRAARDLMIRANLRLVVKIAMAYKACAVPLLDLISEGNLGLVKAVERFDPRKGGKLSTYAAWWIRQSVRHALAHQGKTIRLPVHLLDRIATLRRTELALTERFGREPSDEDVAAELRIPTEKVAHWKSVSARPASLDAQIGDEDGAATFGEIVCDEHAANPYECLRDKSATCDLHAMIAALGAREATIIRLRFGLENDGELTLEEISRRLGITRERIRQLEGAALRKLRRAVARHEKQRTRVEVELEESQRLRAAMIKEPIENSADGLSSPSLPMNRAA